MPKRKRSVCGRRPRKRARHDAVAEADSSPTTAPAEATESESAATTTSPAAAPPPTDHPPETGSLAAGASVGGPRRSARLMLKAKHQRNAGVASPPSPAGGAGLECLTATQRTAFAALVQRSAAKSKDARPQLLKRVKALGFTEADMERALLHVRDIAPLIIHVTPDVLERLAKDTHYRSLFETGTSNGAASTYWRRTWEKTLFNGSYDEATDAERVKYGTIALLNEKEGLSACFYYGRIILELRRSVRERVSFANGDSGDNCVAVGTLEHCAHVLAEFPDNYLKDILSTACAHSAQRVHCVHSYPEIQIHGEILLDRDIASITLPAIARSSATTVRIAKLFSDRNACLLLQPP